MRTRTNTPTRRVAALLALSLTLAAGCQAKADEPLPPAAQVQTPTPSPTPTETPSPTPETYEVPAVIDEAYVERVLNALYRVEGDAVRSMLEAGAVTVEAEGMLRSLYSEEQVDPLLNSYREEAGRGFPTARTPFGDVTVDVHEVFTGTSSCIFVSGLRDFSQTTTAEFNPEREDFMWLLPAEPGQDANPTPWRIQLQLFRTDGVPEDDRCD